MMRVLAALVLAPAAIAIAYAGGWLWAALVTLAAIGLYVEWLMIVGAVRETRVIASASAALAVGGICLALGRIDAASSCWPSASSPWRCSRPNAASGPRRDLLYAAAAEFASVLVRLDQV